MSKLLLGVTLILGAGCAPPPSLGPSPFLGPSFEWKTSRPFQRALHSAPGSEALERARIDYLLERISKSPYNFLRNGSRYTGKQAKNHFRWKYFLKHGEVKTAEDFVNRVATRSKISGEPYFVQLAGRRRYPLQTVLLEELSSFDQALEKKRQLMAKTSGETH